MSEWNTKRMEDRFDGFIKEMGKVIDDLGVEKTMKVLLVESHKRRIEAKEIKKALQKHLCDECNGSGTTISGYFGKGSCSFCEGTGYKNPKFGVKIKDEDGNFNREKYELEGE